jgi:NodT family efflux transporter outer membrane factor (OMF) lipoprotein
MRILIPFSILVAMALSACQMGPHYQKPTIEIPANYKQAKGKWAPVTAHAAPGEWWTIFRDEKLNALEAELNNQNQSIKVAKAQYVQAVALVDQARAAYFPTLSATNALNFQKNSGSASSAKTNAKSVHSLGLNASWEPDVWGSVRDNVDAANATAEASLAQVAATRLLMQANLAQYYVELRGVDQDQYYLNKMLQADQKILFSANQKIKEGVDSLAQVIQARSAVDAAKQAAENNKINRALYEHAIAVLLGKTPEAFSLAVNTRVVTTPHISVNLPSTLLEQRPDIAVAERNVAAANAKIGVAVAAYFPSFTLSGVWNFAQTALQNWSAWPLYTWSVGPQLAATLFDGGLRGATLNFAHANYDATVAQYRQTVLSAFQDVDDNLTQVRLLKLQAVIANHAATDARLSFQLSKNQFQEGVIAAPDLASSEITALSAEKNAADTKTLQLTYTVALIKAFGGDMLTSQ